MTLPVIRVAGLIDDDGARQNEHRILTLFDLDAVRVCPGEPAFRNGRDRSIAAPERVLVVHEVAFSLQIIRTRHIDGEPMVEEREELLLHDRDQDTAACDLVRLAPREHPLLDERELVTLEVLEGELVAKAERLPIDEIDVAPGFIANVEIVAPGEELLAHHVAHWRTVEEGSAYRAAQYKGRNAPFALRQQR